ncbi:MULTISPECIES: hypothetical protein [Anaeromyxobacter]|uniref:hypothetical protein n=1 Tax=Anaeromyxobacter TaxID=161492 RepID=UPI001F58DA16|nr:MULTISPECIES: hypothetical protein [unclassified Anaeromyxobacter]
MRVRTVVAVALLAGAGVARAGVSLGVEATIGAEKLGVERAPLSNEALLPMGQLGGTVLLRVGTLALGAAAGGYFHRSQLERYDASGLAGLSFDVLPLLRIELLGEVGAANLRTRSDLGEAVAGNWSTFYGVRPGVSLKLPVFPLRLGVWGLARWGLPGMDSHEPALGMLGRVGVDF